MMFFGLLTSIAGVGCHAGCCGHSGCGGHGGCAGAELAVAGCTWVCANAAYTANHPDWRSEANCPAERTAFMLPALSLSQTPLRDVSTPEAQQNSVTESRPAETTTSPVEFPDWRKPPPPAFEWCKPILENSWFSCITLGVALEPERR